MDLAHPGPVPDREQVEDGGVEEVERRNKFPPPKKGEVASDAPKVAGENKVLSEAQGKKREKEPGSC